MTEKTLTLVYCVGGLADWRNDGFTGFSKLCREIESAPDLNTFTPTGDEGQQFKLQIHSYRQSRCIPFAWWANQKSEENSCIPTFTDQTAEDLAYQLDAEIEKAKHIYHPNKIIIIAYSAGSALARRALLKAKKRESDGIDSWCSVLTKTIHIGGMNLGWEFNSQMPKLYLWLGPILRPLFPYWFVWQIYRGSKFISDTRIGLNRLSTSSPPETFYLLGTRDQFLSPGDAVEPGGMQETKQDPIYLEVSGVDHRSILNYKTSNLNHILLRILQSDNHREDIAKSLQSDGLVRLIPKKDIDDYLAPMDNEPARRIPSVKHVVIVLHGIRDSGFWAKRIAHCIKAQHRKDKTVAGCEYFIQKANQQSAAELRIVSLGYGYFSLWDFLRPGGRRQAVEWFQNLYADITALYPNAEVSFIGHSNGTYLGTHALQCDNVNFRYMVLAGSVVRCDFWDTKGKEWRWKDKVHRLLNIQGVDDWIVGLLPGGLETIPILGKKMDLGGLGTYGNRYLVDDFEQIKLIGDHGAGIVDKGWDHLAKFVLQPDPITAPAPVKTGSGFRYVSVNDDLRKKEMRLNTYLKMVRPLGGLYIYLAVFICFSPLFLIVWPGLYHWLSDLLSGLRFYLHVPGMQIVLPLLNALAASWGEGLKDLNMLLHPLLRLPPLRLSEVNGFALLLLLPIGILGIVFLVWNAFNTLMGFIKESLRAAKAGESIEMHNNNLLISFFLWPLLAYVITRIIAEALQGPQTVMSLLILLSVLSFSLLKRI